MSTGTIQEVVVTTPDGRKHKSQWERHGKIWICFYAERAVRQLSERLATGARMRHLRDMYGYRFRPDLSTTNPL